MTKDWKISRTIVFGILTALTGIAEFIYGLPVGASAFTIVSGIAIVVLRCMTSTPIEGTPGAKAVKKKKAK